MPKPSLLDRLLFGPPVRLLVVVVLLSVAITIAICVPASLRLAADKERFVQECLEHGGSETIMERGPWLCLTDDGRVIQEVRR